MVGADYAVVVLAALIERFWECREEDGLSAALTGWLVTIAVAVAVSLVLMLPRERACSEAHPLQLVGILTSLSILVGRCRGVLVSEFLRFRATFAEVRSSAEV